MTGPHGTVTDYLKPPPPLPPVDFGTDILKALLYENIAHVPYHLSVESNDEYLVAMSREMLEALMQSPSLTVFITSRQRSTLGAPPEAV